MLVPSARRIFFWPAKLFFGDEFFFSAAKFFFRRRNFFLADEISFLTTKFFFASEKFLADEIFLASKNKISPVKKNFRRRKKNFAAEKKISPAKKKNSSFFWNKILPKDIICNTLQYKTKFWYNCLQPYNFLEFIYIWPLAEVTLWTYKKQQQKLLSLEINLFHKHH